MKSKYDRLTDRHNKLQDEFREQNAQLEEFRKAFCERSGLPVEDMQTVPSMSHAILRYIDFLRERFFIQSHARRAVENMNPPSLATHPVVNSLEKEIDSLKSELEHCHAEIDGYQKTLQTLEKSEYQITVNPDCMFDRGAVKFHLENLKTWIMNKADSGLAAHDVAEICTRLDAVLEKVT